MRAAERVSAVVSAAVIAVVAAACAGGGDDKAGGRDEGTPLVLTLEHEDDLTQSGAPEFAAAVKERSAGSIQIELRYAGRGVAVDYEKGVVEDVKTGKVQLGIVGVRVWDTIGVTSFRGLLAPFLVDSFQLEQQVLTSPLAGRMLAGVERAGVVGIALHPGPLRRPLGLTRPLVGRDGYRRALIAIRLGGVAGSTFRALGGSAKGYVPGSVAGFDGTEVDANTLVYNGWDRHPSVLTANVVFWPKPYSIVMNRRAFEALTGAQRDILLSAGRDSLMPELRQTERDERTGLAAACKRGRLSFVTASRSELASLHAAVQPVYDEVGRDALAREVMRAVYAMRRDGSATPPALPPCRSRLRGAAATTGAPLEGRWRLHWTRDELIGVGVDPRLLAGAPESATVTIEFKDGRYEAVAKGAGLVATGRYSVEGDVMTLVYDAPAPRGYIAGNLYRQRWSIFRKSLRFSRVPRSDVDFVLLVNPLTRVD